MARGSVPRESHRSLPGTVGSSSTLGLQGPSGLFILGEVLPEADESQTVEDDEQIGHRLVEGGHPDVDVAGRGQSQADDRILPNMMQCMRTL